MQYRSRVCFGTMSLQTEALGQSMIRQATWSLSLSLSLSSLGSLSYYCLTHSSDQVADLKSSTVTDSNGTAVGKIVVGTMRLDGLCECVQWQSNCTAGV
jgi:hypothetical protein